MSAIFDKTMLKMLFEHWVVVDVVFQNEFLLQRSIFCNDSEMVVYWVTFIFYVEFYDSSLFIQYSYYRNLYVLYFIFLQIDFLEKELIFLDEIRNYINLLIFKFHILNFHCHATLSQNSEFSWFRKVNKVLHLILRISKVFHCTVIYLKLSLIVEGIRYHNRAGFFSFGKLD